MKRILILSGLVAGTLAGAADLDAGVLYENPGWAYLFEGSQAHYDDPDGPNPDYINGSPTNEPGGKSGSPALDTRWKINGSHWDGSAPGATLGGVPGSPAPIPPAAPGGVGTYASSGVSYLRIQDAGQPQSWGWADKGAQASPASPKQEGNNRRIQFAHPLAEDPGNSGNAAILDTGITISLRARLSTLATGPLDKFYDEDGPTVTTPQTWPVDGKGYPVANNGRGMFMITQDGGAGPGQLAFSLLDQDTITDSGIPVNKTGLVFNNNSGSPNTNAATAGTLNIVEIADNQLTNWQEFWITVKALPAPVGESTHEVSVYHNGGLTPLVYNTVLGNQNEFGSGANLGLGLSSGTGWGAFDVDFFGYKEGIVAPTLVDAGVPGDYDHDGVVDGDDLAVWRSQNHTAQTDADGDGDGDVDGGDFLFWQRRLTGAPALAAASAVPEPSSLAIAAGCLSALGLARRRSQ